MTSFFEGLATNISSTVSISITLDPTVHQRTVKGHKNGKEVSLPVYSGNDDISGRIDVELINNNRY